MIRPTRTIIVFDGKGGSNRRKKLFPDYKAGRNMSERLNRSYDFNTKEDEHQSMILQINQSHRLFRLSSNNNNYDREHRS